MKRLSLIGYGRIGGDVLRGLAEMDGYTCGAVLTRRPVSDLPQNTTDVAAFLKQPCDLIIETAGPEALRALGPQALAAAPVWSVGGLALADAGFRGRMAQLSATSGHRLRLFACGMANMPLRAETLDIVMRRDGMGPTWSGRLTDAVAIWPNDLNTAVAAALAGPGVEATHLTMEDSGRGGPHEIRLDACGPGGNWQRHYRLPDMSDASVCHPVAAMILTALQQETQPWQFT
ncbi:MAG: hypothetical protein AB3N23_15245 [Paracoccaceae bacterium]